MPLQRSQTYEEVAQEFPTENTMMPSSRTFYTALSLELLKGCLHHGPWSCLFPSCDGGQPAYHYNCSWCVMVIWLFVPSFGWHARAHAIPRIKLQLKCPPVWSNSGNVEDPQHARFWRLSVILFKDGYHLSSPPKVNQHVAYRCQHVFSQCSWSTYNVVAQHDRLYWGWLIHVVHGHWQYRCMNCLQHLFVLQQFGVFKCKVTCYKA